MVLKGTVGGPVGGEGRKERVMGVNMAKVHTHTHTHTHTRANSIMKPIKTVKMGGR
jgi:hypothetical protein